MIVMSKLATTDQVVRLGLILSDQTLVAKSPHWGDKVLANGMVQPMPHRQIALALGRDAIRYGVLVVNHHSFGGRTVHARHQGYNPGVWDWYSRIENAWPVSTYNVTDVTEVEWVSATSGASIRCIRRSQNMWLAVYSQPQKPSYYAQLWADLRS